MARQPASKPSRNRMIILLDGTWQTDKGDKPPTNVVRLRDLILPKIGDGPGAVYQHIYYDSGVGTGGPPTQRSWDGITGNGLEDIVRGAYRALCHRYEEGMEVYVFGFSRGAFSARSLVGSINAAGLLRAEHCSAVQEKKAWDFYRKPRRYRIPAEKVELDKLCWTKTPQIKCLGVFDTVGARGIPSSFLRRRNEERYGFHDTGLSSIVDYAFHALALDEKRRHYGPTLWSYAFHRNNEPIEQVWFPGCHSDVGGGVESEGLSSLPLYWMIRRMADNQLGLVLDQKGVDEVEKDRDATAAILGGNGLMYSILSMPPAHRIVSQTRPNESEELFVGFPATCGRCARRCTGVFSSGGRKRATTFPRMCGMRNSGGRSMWMARQPIPILSAATKNSSNGGKTAATMTRCSISCRRSGCPNSNSTRQS